MRELQRWEFKRYYGGLGGGDMEQVGGVGLLPLGCGVEWVKADEAEAALAERDETIANQNTEISECVAEIAKLTARVAELEGGWISVDDRLPATGEIIWIPSHDEVGVCHSKYDGENFRYCFGDGKIFLGPYENVTHWMPLPTPPNKGDGDD